MKVINSLDNSRVKYAYSLKMHKNRTLNKEFLIEGKKVLKMALEAHLVKEIFSSIELDEIPENFEYYRVNEGIINKLSSVKNPEGVVAICSFMDNKLPLKPYQKVIYLDHINDPGNMGTMIRTALGLGYDAVFVSKGSCDIYNDKVVASSKGAIFKMPIFEKELEELKKDYQIIVTSLDDRSENVEDILNKKKSPFALVFGNEAHGVEESVLALSDLLVKIPMKDMDSLNVSIAAGIFMYLLNK